MQDYRENTQFPAAKLPLQGTALSFSARLVVYLLLPAFLCGQAATRGTAESTPNFGLVRSYVRERMVADQIPAIALAVTRGKQILWEEAFGSADQENRISATVHTPFYIASLTKAITGTGVMVLQERQQINLDHPVNEYLGPAKVRSPMWDVHGATVRRVAAHTAGLTTYNRKCDDRDRECHVSTETAIQRYGILFWPPGDHFDYSNLGYGILGQVSAHVSGKGYADFLRDEVFRPLGMKDCFLGTAEGLPGQAAAQYDSASHTRTPLQRSDTPGASSVRCSAHDLALLGMFALGTHLPSQRQILSDTSLRMMLNPTVETGDDELYGFGWSLQPDRYGYESVYAQGGTNDSFAVLQTIPSQGITVAVIANTGTTVPFEIVDKILSELLPRYRENVEHPHPNKASPTTLPKPTTLAGNWTGTIQTWKGNIPFAVSISPARDVQVKVGRQPWLKATDVDLRDPRLYCVAREAIVTPDAPQPSPEVEIEVYIRSGALVGAATTRGGAQLPFWVRLERSSSDPRNPQ